MCGVGLKGKQATDMSWGDIPVVVMFGDDYQLPPVLDSPVYRCRSKSTIAMRGSIIWKQFDKCINLKTVVRQNESEGDLKKFLIAIRDYKVTNDQVLWLQKFQWEDLIRLHGSNFEQSFEEGALYLYSTKREVNEHNRSKLEAINKFVPVIKSSAECKGKHALSVTEDKNGGLAKHIFLAEGCKVFLTSNLCISFGLFNGSPGVIRHIIYVDGNKPQLINSRPNFVIVEFPSYSGPAFVDFNPKLVPIVPIGRPVDCSCSGCTRLQLPLRVGFATTIHRSQGMTIGQGQPNRYVVIHPGKESFEKKSPGARFVAFSRAKSSGSATIYPDFALHKNFLSNNDLLCIKVDNELTRERNKEIERLSKIANNTVVEYTNQ